MAKRGDVDREEGEYVKAYTDEFKGNKEIIKIGSEDKVHRNFELVGL